jgi:hypothetical protein
MPTVANLLDSVVRADGKDYRRQQAPNEDDSDYDDEEEEEKDDDEGGGPAGQGGGNAAAGGPPLAAAAGNGGPVAGRGGAPLRLSQVPFAVRKGDQSCPPSSCREASTGALPVASFACSRPLPNPNPHNNRGTPRHREGFSSPGLRGSCLCSTFSAR